MSEIILEITDADWQNHTGFASNCKCLLATAAKRQFNTRDVGEGVNRIYINGVLYYHECFAEDDYDAAARTKKPFTITLIKQNNNAN